MTVTAILLRTSLTGAGVAAVSVGPGGYEAVLDAFQADLKRLDAPAIVQRHIFHGTCVAVSEDQHFNVKDRIAAHFHLQVNRDVFVVGSAKLGFSIAPPKRYVPFGNHSDIDVAIVNHELYQTVWHSVHDYAETGGYWPRRTQFENYLAKGWIRPDKLPPSTVFPFNNDWWEFFQSLHRERCAGPYKITGAIYHDMDFLERYQERAVLACQSAIEEQDENVGYE